MIRRAARALALALPVATLAVGCASAHAQAPAAPADTPLPSRPGFVFLIHGIWPDGEWLGWMDEASLALRKAGIEPIPVGYDSFVLGYVLGSGTDAPADRLGAFVRALGREHGRSRCAAPLRFHSIAFSGGTVVTLKASWRGVIFDSAHFGGSPIPFFSSSLAGAVRDGRIRELRNYWSPFDGVVGLVFGCGQLGFHGAGDDEGLAIENVPCSYIHLAPPFDEALTGEIARRLGESARTSPAHTCLSDARFSAFFRRARDRLARGEDPGSP